MRDFSGSLKLHRESDPEKKIMNVELRISNSIFFCTIDKIPVEKMRGWKEMSHGNKRLC